MTAPGRPLTHSQDIVKELQEMNQRFEAKTQEILTRLPSPPLSEEEKTTLLKLGVPIPETKTKTDIILEDIDKKVDATYKWVTQLFGLIVTILIVWGVSWMISWGGCSLPPPDPKPVPPNGSTNNNGPVPPLLILNPIERKVASEVATRPFRGERSYC